MNKTYDGNYAVSDIFNNNFFYSNDFYRKSFFKPDEMESEGDSDFEIQNVTNDDMLIGFDEEDEIIQFRTRTDSDSTIEFDTQDIESIIDSDLSDIDDNFEDSDEEASKNTTQDESIQKSNARNNDSNAASTSTTNADDDDDGEDDVIQKILANAKTPKTHPPDINIDDYVTDLSFHPDNDILAAATMSGDVMLYKYSVDDNILVNTLEIHSKAIRDIEFNHDGSKLYSASKDRSIMLSDTETGKFVREYAQAHEQPISKMHIIDEHLFATGDDDGTIKCWDVRERERKAIFSLKEVDDYITGLLTKDANKVLLATSGDGYLTAINIGSR